MPLRPVTAIFVHPKDHYYVVYDNGQRYKLNRMKLDSNAWQRKQAYTGSDEDIFLLKNQRITDNKLSQHLTTFDWPDSLKGRSLKFFLTWWEKQGYHWLAQHHPDNNNTQTQIIESAAVTNEKQPQNLQTASKQMTEKDASKANQADNKTDQAADSLFDDMLNELSDEISNSI